MCKLPEAIICSGQLPTGIYHYNRKDLLCLRRSAKFRLDRDVLNKLKECEILQYRGTRAGKARKLNCAQNNNNIEISPSLIPTVLMPRYSDHKTEINNNHKKAQNQHNLIRIKFQPSCVTKSQSNIKICCLNARSVKNKTIFLCDFILSNELDIFAITETWLGASLDRACTNELLPDGYKIKHVPRSTGKRGGGVAIIYKTNIELRINASTCDKYTSFEFMDCNVVINGYSLRLTVVYRPPPSQKNGLKTSVFLEEEWPKFLAEFALEDKNTIITGDLNLHLDNQIDRETMRFNDVLQSSGMKQHVNEPTHVRGHTLDVVITREVDKIINNLEVTDPGLLDNLGKISNDHFAITFNVLAAKPPPVRKIVSFRKIHSINVDEFREEIANSEAFKNSLLIDDIDQITDTYNKELIKLIEKHAPLRTKTITLRPNCPWYTEEIFEAKHLKRKFERAWRKSNLAIDHEIYRSQCATVNKLLKETKINYYSEKVSLNERDPRALSKLTKHLMNGSDEKILPLGKSPGELVQDFSDFFITKIETIRNNISSHTSPEITDKNCDDKKLSDHQLLKAFNPISEEEIQKIITKSPDKSCHLDPIPTWLLKSCLKELLPIITKIINTSLEAAYVPKVFKSAHVKPLLKKQGLDQNDFKNYRPVSNLPFLSKILEKVVGSQIERHVEFHDLQETHQSAYRKHHSTETALLKVQNDILQSLDKNNATVLVMLDLSAAFDTIDHATLINRLENLFGLAEKPLTWVKSYLSDRYQTVYIDGKLSKPVLMKFSVPQGSVLGPKFYTMYTKPVGSICQSHGLDHHFYADDSQLYLEFKPKDSISKKEVVCRVERCLSDIVEWMDSNMLKLNKDKTELIVYSSQRNEVHVEDITVTIGSTETKSSKGARNLGVFLDSRFDMDTHVNHVCKSCYAQIRQIGRIRQYLSTHATKSLVNSLVTSRLDYCNSLLNGVSKTTLNKLQHVQNTAARLVTRNSRYCHITPVLKELHWLPVEYRIQFKVLTQTYKAVNGESPKYIQNLLQMYQPGRDLRTKQRKLMLVVPKTRTVTYGDRCFATIAPKLWNRLPSAVKESKNINSFKRSLKTHFFIQHFGN